MGRRHFVIVMLVIGTCTLPVAAKQEIHDTQHRFSITVPDGWTIKPGVASGTIFKAVYRDPKNRLAMITINKQPIRTGEKLPSPAGLHKTLSAMPFVATTRLLDHGNASISGVPVVWIVLATEYRTGFSQIERRYLFYRDSYLYLVLATTDADQSYYSSLAPVLHSAVLSIVFR